VCAMGELLIERPMRASGLLDSVHVVPRRDEEAPGIAATASYSSTVSVTVSVQFVLSHSHTNCGSAGQLSTSSSIGST
jgi:hypothetical protein